MSKTLVLVIVILLWIALIVLTVKGGPYSMAVLGCVFLILLVLRRHERKEARRELWNRMAEREDVGRDGYEVVMIKEDDWIVLIGWRRGYKYEVRLRPSPRGDYGDHWTLFPGSEYFSLDCFAAEGLVAVIPFEGSWFELMRFPVTDRVAEALGVKIPLQDSGEDRELEGGI